MARRDLERRLEELERRTVCIWPADPGDVAESIAAWEEMAAFWKTVPPVDQEMFLEAMQQDFAEYLGHGG